MAKDRKEKEVMSVADATSQLESRTKLLDEARQNLADAESLYQEACQDFDAAVSKARKDCSR